MRTVLTGALASIGMLLAIGANASSANASSASAGGVRPAAELRPDSIRAHLEFLADDLLEGRDAGTRGYDIAAAYVASQFKQVGLQPAGSDGYFQHVPLRRSVLVPGSFKLVVDVGGRQRTFTDADHVAARPSATERQQQLAAPCVFAGYGIVAPEVGRDDYAGLDVRGKFVVVLGGPPADLPSEVAAHLASTDEQRSRAAERGALGVLIVYTPALEARWPFKQLGPVYEQPQFDALDPATGAPDSGALRASALVDPEAAAALFEGAPRSLAQVLAEANTRSPRGFALASSATFSRKARHEQSSSPNVAGMLPGSDPLLAREVLVFVSHLDHVGIGKPRDGDAIYNGALDNASGIAAMLEVARALRASGVRLERSVLFLAVTAEEKGLVGSDYFAHHPTIPAERLVGVINLDGSMPFYAFIDVIGFGADSSTLGLSLERAAAGMGIAVTPDPTPEQSYFTRSDHYPFVRQGVPGIFLITGFGVGPDGRNGEAISEEWTARHLHQPSDDLNQPFDYAELTRWAELFRRWTIEAANAPERPLWYRGDFFGDRFAPQAPKAPPPTAAVTALRQPAMLRR